MSSKSRSAGRQRRRHKKRTRHAHKSLGGVGTTIIDAPRRKISESLREVARPLLDAAETQAQAETALTTGVVAWNLAVASEAERPKFWRDAEEAFDGSGEPWAQMQEMLVALTARKQVLFPDDQRFILSAEITTAEQPWRIQAAAIHA